MSERFFSPQPIASDRVTLTSAEAHHLLHVMRASAGDELTLFDGSGSEYAARVESLGRSEAIVRIVERREIDRELPFELAVGVALPKGDRQKWLVEKLTELGVTTLVPLRTERGVAQPTDTAIDRLQRTVIEASKQCGRNRLMRIVQPQQWTEWIASPSSELTAAGQNAGAVRLLAHPGGVPFSAIDRQPGAATDIAIGPEGGLTEAEVSAALAAGWQQVDLGPRILRVEMAAVALAAVAALSLTCAHQDAGRG